MWNHVHSAQDHHLLRSICIKQLLLCSAGVGRICNRSAIRPLHRGWIIHRQICGLQSPALIGSNQFRDSGLDGLQAVCTIFGS
jgi:hypothetical protein